MANPPYIPVKRVQRVIPQRSEQREVVSSPPVIYQAVVPKPITKQRLAVAVAVGTERQVLAIPPIYTNPPGATTKIRTPQRLPVLVDRGQNKEVLSTPPVAFSGGVPYAKIDQRLPLIPDRSWERQLLSSPPPAPAGSVYMPAVRQRPSPLIRGGHGQLGAQAVPPRVLGRIRSATAAVRVVGRSRTSSSFQTLTPRMSAGRIRSATAAVRTVGRSRTSSSFQTLTPRMSAGRIRSATAAVRTVGRSRIRQVPALAVGPLTIRRTDRRLRSIFRSTATLPSTVKPPVGPLRSHRRARSQWLSRTFARSVLPTAGVAPPAQLLHPPKVRQQRAQAVTPQRSKVRQTLFGSVAVPKVALRQKVDRKRPPQSRSGVQKSVSLSSRVGWLRAVVRPAQPQRRRIIVRPVSRFSRASSLIVRVAQRAQRPVQRKGTSQVPRYTSAVNFIPRVLRRRVEPVKPRRQQVRRGIPQALLSLPWRRRQATPVKAQRSSVRSVSFRPPAPKPLVLVARPVVRRLRQVTARAKLRSPVVLPAPAPNMSPWLPRVIAKRWVRPLWRLRPRWATFRPPPPPPGIVIVVTPPGTIDVTQVTASPVIDVAVEQNPVLGVTQGTQSGVIDIIVTPPSEIDVTQEPF